MYIYMCVYMHVYIYTNCIQVDVAPARGDVGCGSLNSDPETLNPYQTIELIERI